MLVERKIDCCNRQYLEFNGCSSLYFINGFYKTYDNIDIFIGSKVIYKNLDILFKVIQFCLCNFRIINIHTKDKIYTLSK